MSFFDAVRVALGLILLPHFVLKIPRVTTLYKFYESARLPMPKLLAPVGFVVEGVFVASLLTNIFLREGAILGCLFLIGAAVATVRKNGPGRWRWEQGGPEYPLFLAVLLGLIALYAS